jgi:hypothetical protein
MLMYMEMCIELCVEMCVESACMESPPTCARLKVQSSSSGTVRPGRRISSPAADAPVRADDHRVPPVVCTRTTGTGPRPGGGGLSMGAARRLLHGCGTADAPRGRKTGPHPPC